MSENRDIDVTLKMQDVKLAEEIWHFLSTWIHTTCRQQLWGVKVLMERNNLQLHWSSAGLG